MRYIDKELHIEMIPESEADREYLAKEYPHCQPCAYVCVAKPTEMPPAFVRAMVCDEFSDKHPINWRNRSSA